MTFMQLNKNRNLTFWSLHLMGWMAYGFAQYAGALLYGKAIAYTKVILIASATGVHPELVAALVVPSVVEATAGRDDRRRAARCVLDSAGLAYSGEPGLHGAVPGRPECSGRAGSTTSAAP
jgi:hypothetical protein